jgi:hypothetical protein
MAARVLGYGYKSWIDRWHGRQEFKGNGNMRAKFQASSGQIIWPD